MFKIFIGVLLSAIFPMSASAVSGTGVQDGGLEQSCRILILGHQSQEILGMCSGTLTGPNEVTTAGHCVLGRTLDSCDFQVDCGYTGFESLGAKTITLEDGFVLYIKGPVFKETHFASAVQIGKEFGTVFKGNDVAKLTLADSSSLTPLSVAPTADISAVYFDSQGLMRENVGCRLSGFGQSNGDVAGKLHLAPLTAQSRLQSLTNKMQFVMSIIQPPTAELDAITTTLSQPYYWLNGAYLQEILALSDRVPITLMPGDSGSALLCQKDASSPWQVVGVDSTLAMDLSTADASVVELLNSFGLPETDYIPL